MNRGSSLALTDSYRSILREDGEKEKELMAYFSRDDVRKLLPKYVEGAQRETRMRKARDALYAFSFIFCAAVFAMFYTDVGRRTFMWDMDQTVRNLRILVMLALMMFVLLMPAVLRKSTMPVHWQIASLAKEERLRLYGKIEAEKKEIRKALRSIR
jgi:hypothetical protein